MNQNEIEYEDCDRIFDVLKWANLNEFEWASMSLNKHVSQCLNDELSQYLKSEHYIYEKVIVK